MANQTFTDGPTLNDGVKMPWLGLGVWKTKEGEEVIQSVKSAIAAVPQHRYRCHLRQ